MQKGRADATARIVIMMTVINDRDADRLELLDRIAVRIPELDLDRQSVDEAVGRSE